MEQGRKELCIFVQTDWFSLLNSFQIHYFLKPLWFIGTSYPGLKDEDFAVGFMNNIMEKKLKDFSKIICMDGTHGTNRRNWELTTVLVKDDQNMGFPVAFLVTNRLDQVIQNIFRELKSRLGQTIDAEYIMTDDDPKYYNAWTLNMETGQSILYNI